MKNRYNYSFCGKNLGGGFGIGGEVDGDIGGIQGENGLILSHALTCSLPNLEKLVVVGELTVEKLIAMAILEFRNNDCEINGGYMPVINLLSLRQGDYPGRKMVPDSQDHIWGWDETSRHAERDATALKQILTDDDLSLRGRSQ